MIFRFARPGRVRLQSTALDREYRDRLYCYGVCKSLSDHCYRACVSFLNSDSIIALHVLERT